MLLMLSLSFIAAVPENKPIATWEDEIQNLNLIPYSKSCFVDTVRCINTVGAYRRVKNRLRNKCKLIKQLIDM